MQNCKEHTPLPVTLKRVKFGETKGPENKLPVLQSNSPVTTRLIAKLILGSVLTWHSYCPVSAIRAPRNRKPQKSLLLECTDSNLLSAENVRVPDVSMCKSLVLIQDTCKIVFIFIFYFRHAAHLNLYITVNAYISFNILNYKMFCLITVEMFNVKSVFSKRESNPSFLALWYLLHYTELSSWVPMDTLNGFSFFFIMCVFTNFWQTGIFFQETHQDKHDIFNIIYFWYQIYIIQSNVHYVHLDDFLFKKHV